MARGYKNTKLKIVFLLLACLITSKCSMYKSSNNYESISQTQITAGSAFQKALYIEYMDIAEQHYFKGEHKKADRYALRAKKADQESFLLPYEIRESRVSKRDYAEMQQGRVRLLNILTLGGSHKFPMRTARAQASFDCWAAESKDATYLAERCHKKFTGNLEEVENRLNQCKPASNVIERSMLPDPMESSNEEPPEIFKIEY
jgi:hypothetical protein